MCIGKLGRVQYINCMLIYLISQYLDKSEFIHIALKVPSGQIGSA
jgi:hypothetical protein